ncbi:MAG TPA: bifunctional diguanylate cyclase/phosphodiesterase [Mycobacteriales bacterium]|jgi:diguanylate cyclase (GGDEF)-like protein|nr:bifunctional diguanylate cyclase/phosphodiesterase [Mycobacteriales bacterium]
MSDAARPAVAATGPGGPAPPSAARVAVRAYALAAGLLAGGVSLYFGVIADLAPLRTGISLWPVVIAVLTLLLGASAITLQFRRQGQTLSMTELPLAVGLFAVSPGALILAKIAGHAVDGLRRRVPAYKTIFNLAMAAFQAPLGVVVFRLVLGNEPANGPRAWLAAFAAVQVSNLVSALAVFAVIGLTQSRADGAELDVAVGKWLLVSVVETSLALVAVEALRADARAGVLLAVVTLLLLGFTRAYARLRDRNEELAAVYDFSRSVALGEEDEDLPALVAAKLRNLLRAERAEVLVAHDGGLACWSATDDGVRMVPVEPGSWPWRDVAATAAPVSAPRGADAIAVPMRGEHGVAGMLAAYDRMGDVRRFGRVDVQLLEALAAQAGPTLESARLVERLRHEAAHDTLTGLANWSGLSAHVDEAIRGGGPVALVLMDLDRFKDVNDTLGHHNGDELLVELAGRLAAYCGEARVVGRLGGDEFAVVLAQGSDAEGAARIGRELLALVAEPVVLDGVRVEMAASVGIAIHPEHGLDANALLQRADVAMYSAKTGHTGVAVYQPSEDHVSARRLVLAGELRRAIDDGALVVAYQPKASLEDGGAVGAEALLRWTHRELGFVAPDEFIPLAERTGLIVPLTTYVLDRALAQCRAWHDAGLDIGVAVNISVRNLLDSDLPDEIGGLLVRHGVEPRRLTLEVTESSVMADPDRAIDVLERLSRIGIRLSVDDFGTGYSSLTYLKRLPVNEVKIDKSFVMSMATDAGDAAIVRSIIDLGVSLGLAVVAEGVEDTESWERLAELGCDIVQGYALCRPVPAEDATAWLRAWDPARAVRRSARRVTELAPRRRLARGQDS